MYTGDIVTSLIDFVRSRPHWFFCMCIHRVYLFKYTTSFTYQKKKKKKLFNLRL